MRRRGPGARCKSRARTAPGRSGGPRSPTRTSRWRSCDQSRSGVAAGRANGDAEARIAKLKADLDDKFPLGPEYFAGIYGGFGCFAAASELLHRHKPPDGNELEVDPIEWDASFFASLAHAGGAVWEESDGNPEARGAYWQWFLTDPVPRFGPT